jgi:hypothetical protein
MENSELQNNKYFDSGDLSALSLFTYVFIVYLMTLNTWQQLRTFSFERMIGK